MPLCLQDRLRGSSPPSQGKSCKAFPAPLRAASATAWNGFVKLRINQESGCSSLLFWDTEPGRHARAALPCSQQELADEQLSPRCFPAVCCPSLPEPRSAPSPEVRTHPWVPQSHFPLAGLQEHAALEALPRAVPFGSRSVIRLRDCPLTARVVEMKPVNSSAVPPEERPCCCSARLSFPKDNYRMQIFVNHPFILCPLIC